MSRPSADSAVAILFLAARAAVRAFSNPGDAEAQHLAFDECAAAMEYALPCLAPEQADGNEEVTT